MFKLKGVIPPMITPFDAKGNLDIHNLEKLVGFLVDHVDGLYICGSYGSGPLMNVEERKTVAEVSVKVAAGKIPIVAHVGNDKHPGHGGTFPPCCGNRLRSRSCSGTVLFPS